MTPSITATDVSFCCRLGLVAEGVRFNNDGGPKSTEQLPPSVGGRTDAELHFTRRTQLIGDLPLIRHGHSPAQDELTAIACPDFDLVEKRSDASRRGGTTR